MNNIDNTNNATSTPLVFSPVATATVNGTTVLLAGVAGFAWGVLMALVRSKPKPMFPPPSAKDVVKRALDAGCIGVATGFIGGAIVCNRPTGVPSPDAVFGCAAVLIGWSLGYSAIECRDGFRRNQLTSEIARREEERARLRFDMA